MEAPLIVIVGPTASGKSGLATELAEKFSGEIICSDSRTVYKEMSIGTAKPSRKDQAKVPHWGIDLVDPGEHFSAAAFKQYANEIISQVRSRGNVPFMVGGSGLYVDGVIFDYQFGDFRPELRDSLEEMTIEQLHNYCLSNNINLPENRKNKRYIVRAIEQNGINSKRLMVPLPNTIVVGITTEKSILKKRIHERVEQMFENGVVEEAKKLGKKYGWKSEAMTANIYKQIHEFLIGAISEAELKSKIELADWHLAKRQLTWFKRNPYITWKSLSEAENYIANTLAEYR